MQEFNNFLVTLDGYIGSANWFAYALLGVGLGFTLYLGFPQIRYFRQAIRIVRGKFDKEGDEGDTTHFQALTTALSGTVGTGNIAGVALAVYIGGPAALFWMLVTAFFGMTTKFVEVTLSHKYRDKAEDGTMAGGPMYYMTKRLNIKKADGSTIKTGKALAIFFAIATVISSFGTGNLPQSNSIATAIKATFGIEQWIVGAVLGVFLFMVIVGGIKRIAKVTERLVPTMAAIYLIGALAVIFANFGNIGSSFVSIFADVFTGSAAMGGFLGATLNFAFIKGVGRGLFSNEAGQGSAPIAHASAKAQEPVSEGMVALLEPFIDTIIICTITGLVLLSSGVWNEKHQNVFENSDLLVLDGSYSESDETDKEAVAKHLNNVESLSPYSGTVEVANGNIASSGITIIHARSFAEDVVVKQEEALYTGSLQIDGGSLGSDNPDGISLEGKSLVHSAKLTTIGFTRGWFGDWGQYIVSIGLLLFAFSTAISWSYYGDRAMTFLLGSKSVVYYRVVYVAGFILASFTDTTIVWSLSAIAIAVMTLPNLLGITLLSGEMKRTVKEYWADFHEKWPQYKKK
ncbi:MAG TPA: sodium:alanine symporter family protein [Cytophagales bacterium]|nr:sodium:alanine symporter family protein [Cytophagales bacterium]HAA21945.1 sodium:alanine symporter family protein [Cytophagales bacterium]HAP61359.1 sodium:alanine symporter family protein [Cytophagales bacterium]